MILFSFPQIGVGRFYASASTIQNPVNRFAKVWCGTLLPIDSNLHDAAHGIKDAVVWAEGTISYDYALSATPGSAWTGARSEAAHAGVFVETPSSCVSTGRLVCAIPPMRTPQSRSGRSNRASEPVCCRMARRARPHRHPHRVSGAPTPRGPLDPPGRDHLARRTEPEAEDRLDVSGVCRLFGGPRRMGWSGICGKCAGKCPDVPAARDDRRIRTRPKRDLVRTAQPCITFPTSPLTQSLGHPVRGDCRVRL